MQDECLDHKNYLRRRTIRVEAEAEIPGCREPCRASCWLPATEQTLKDFRQRARLHPKCRDYTFRVRRCPTVPAIAEARLDDTYSLEDLNFLAKRLAVLSNAELIAMNAIMHGDESIPFEKAEPVYVKDLINITYGLKDLPVIADIYSLRDLGEYVIENEMHPEIPEIPKSCRYLLDREKIGELARDCYDGVIQDGMFVATSDFVMPEVFNGIDLPESAVDKDVVFRLLISQAPYARADETWGSAEWISLPISPAEADRIASLHGERNIEDCMLYDIESAIPALNAGTFNDMLDFRFLNELAGWYLAMSPMEQIKYKAALGAETDLNAERALQIAKDLPAYELSYFTASAKEFFREYVSHFTDNRFDSRWLDEIISSVPAEALLRRLGATQTDYGTVSAFGGHLFTPVSRFNEQTEETPEEESSEGMGMRL